MTPPPQGPAIPWSLAALRAWWEPVVPPGSVVAGRRFEGITIASAAECVLRFEGGDLRARPRDEQRPALARVGAIDVYVRGPGGAALRPLAEALAALPFPDARFEAPAPARRGPSFQPAPPLRRTLGWLVVAALAVAAVRAVSDPHGWPLQAWAPAVGLLYGALSWAIGDVFLFSRYGAYAKTGAREEGAALFIEIDGRPGRLSDCTGFVGVPAACLDGSDANTSLIWQVQEARRWLTAHAGDRPGPLRVALGYRRFYARDGWFEEVREVLAEGTAWPR